MSTKSFQVATTFNINAPTGFTVEGFADEQNPFIPSQSPDYVFRKDFLREFLTFLTNPFGDALFITGPTGSGKTSGVTEIASRLNWPVQQVTAHGRMELSDLIGYHALVSAAPGETPSMQFQYGPLAKAMKHGHILLINEVDLADPGELSGLNDVLEGRPLVISQNGGEIIKPHPKFRVVVTGNSTGKGDASGLYQGVMMQNLAAMDRYRFTKVGYPDAQVELDILEKASPALPKVIRNEMVRVAGSVRSLFLGESGTGEDGQLSVTMSTRTLVRWAKLSQCYRGAPNALAYSLEQALLIRSTAEEREAILRICKDCFGDQWK